MEKKNKETKGTHKITKAELVTVAFIVTAFFATVAFVVHTIVA